MKTSNALWLIAGLLILTCVITNPSPEDHREAVREQAFNALPLDNELSWESALANGMGRSIYDVMVSKMVTRQNFVLFSITRITFSKHQKSVGFGVFGNVFLFKEFRKKLLQAFSGDNPLELSENPSEEEMEVFMERVYSEDYLNQIIGELKNTQIQEIESAQGITGGSRFQTFGNFIETLLRKMDVDKAHYKALNIKDDPNSVEVIVRVPSSNFPVEYRFIYNISNSTFRLEGSNLSEAQEQEVRRLTVPEIYESHKNAPPELRKVDLSEYIGILKQTRVSEIMDNDTSFGTDITYLEYMESLCRAKRYNSWEIRAESLPGNENLIYFLIDFKSYSGEVQENQSILFYRDSGEFYNTMGEEGD